MPRASRYVVVASLAAALSACAEAGDIDVKAAVEHKTNPSARAPQLSPTGSGVSIRPRIGSPLDDEMGPEGPGILIFGGGANVDGAYTWMQSTIGGTRRSAGDVVVLRLDEDDGAFSDHIAGIAPFNSVQTVVISRSASFDELAEVGNVLERAEAVVIASDDASQFIRWRGTAFALAVQRTFNRGGVIAGIGASASVFGQFAHDALPSGEAVETSDALANPYEKTMTFVRETFRFPQLEGLMVDTHFRESDRFGRLTAFMARQVSDGTLDSHPPRVFGLGVDEGNAVGIDRFGRASIFQADGAGGGAYVIAGGTPQQSIPGAPLVYRDLVVARMDSPGEMYDLDRACGTAFVYRVSVSGTGGAPYAPTNPYEAPGIAHECLE